MDFRQLDRGELVAVRGGAILLAWIIIRGHALSWPRGEMTAVIAIAALAFTLFRGLGAIVRKPPGLP